ncbi:MAG: hypothetical protein A3K10_08290 [Bacteroidetes bacterium RIFCSPLOWO2_12_FULL_31_6]|nr:MAG: hypothetical protein A3K10_08290 [Bacteroidetes bacterium RIFCSPLOWO2_12_FULL_31_6]
MIKKVPYSILGIISLAIVLKLFNYAIEQQIGSSSQSIDSTKAFSVFSLEIPKKVDFAGELVPLQIVDVYERLDRELIVNTYWQSQTLLFHKRAYKYFPLMEPILKKYGIPDDFKYLALVESAFTNIVSPAGATGFWQLMDATAISYGLEVNEEVDERYHIEKSTETACKYILEAYKQLKSWTLVAASYNMGITGILNQLERQKANNYYDLLLNEETSRYVFRAIAVKLIITNPQKYGYYITAKNLYKPIETFTISVDSAITDLAVFASLQNVNYKILKIFNPWLRQSYLTNTEHKKYIITLPKNFVNEDYLYDHGYNYEEGSSLEKDSNDFQNIDTSSPNNPINIDSVIKN